jgi:hypothetical protein
MIIPRDVCFFLVEVKNLDKNATFNELQTNCRALVSQRTIPTERPPLVGEVSASFSGSRVSRGQRDGSPRSLISVSSFLILLLVS